MNLSELKNITANDIATAISEAGINKGDTVYVASSLASFGFLKNAAEVVMNALADVVSEEGTIVMPAFNFDFCSTGTFDREQTESKAGTLTEYFRKMPGVSRTCSPPFHTVCAWGRHAAEISAINAVTSFGKDSVFQYLHDTDARILLIGCGFHEGVAHFHWMEELHEVPYRYWKKFEGKIAVDRNELHRAYFMYVRRQGIQVDATPLGEMFEQRGMVTTSKVGLCKMRSFSVKDFKTFFDPVFEKDPFIMVKDKMPATEKKSPVIRVDHIGIVSKHKPRIEKFFKEILLQLSFEGIVPQIGVNCSYYTGLNVDLEFVEPVAEGSRVENFYKKNAASPLHHIAFEVQDLDEAIAYFSGKGYKPIDGEIYLAPKPFHRVVFLSPLFTGGVLFELVANDGLKTKFHQI